jgi:hypothetical protein
MSFLTPKPLDGLLPFVPDKEPRFTLSIPFSTSPTQVMDPFPLPQLTTTTRLTATPSEQDVARQLLARSPSPLPLADQEINHHSQFDEPSVVKQ